MQIHSRLSLRAVEESRTSVRIWNLLAFFGEGLVNLPALHLHPHLFQSHLSCLGRDSAPVPSASLPLRPLCPSGLAVFWVVSDSFLSKWSPLTPSLSSSRPS